MYECKHTKQKGKENRERDCVVVQLSANQYMTTTLTGEHNQSKGWRYGINVHSWHRKLYSHIYTESYSKLLWCCVFSSLFSSHNFHKTLDYSWKCLKFSSGEEILGANGQTRQILESQYASIVQAGRREKVTVLGIAICSLGICNPILRYILCVWCLFQILTATAM